MLYSCGFGSGVVLQSVGMLGTPLIGTMLGLGGPTDCGRALRCSLMDLF